MRYYFNLKNGCQSIPYDEGIDVANLDQARAEILKAIEELREEEPELTEEGVGWTLEICDDTGEIVLSISLGTDLR